MVLFAASSMLLVAFVGLVVDGGEITAQGRAAQNAADGAALAAAFELINYASPTATASALAEVISQKNGAFPGDLAMSYYDATGAATTTPTLVRKVRADVSHSFPTLFLPIIDINSASVSAHAEVNLTVASGVCALCVLATAGTNTLQISGGTTAISGGTVRVNSVGVPAGLVSGTLNVTSAGATPATGAVGTWSVSGSASPSPQAAVASVGDPFSLIPVPSVSGTPTSYSTSGGSASINPGIYSSITLSGGGTTTMNPGTYVLTGQLQIRGSRNLTANNVTIYLACSSYPTPCVSGGSGGNIDVGGNGTINITSPTYGVYQGLTVFSDRNNTGLIKFFGSGTLNTTGSMYAASGPMQFGGGGVIAVNSRIVGNAVTFSSASTVTFNQTQNYYAANTMTLSL